MVKQEKQKHRKQMKRAVLEVKKIKYKCKVHYKYVFQVKSQNPRTCIVIFIEHFVFMKFFQIST